MSVALGLSRSSSSTACDKCFLTASFENVFQSVYLCPVGVRDAKYDKAGFISAFCYVVRGDNMTDIPRQQPKKMARNDVRRYGPRRFPHTDTLL
jgi:hypothetical protein